MVLLPTPAAQAAPAALTEQDITFVSGGLALHGTIIAPATASGSRRPGMVMVHGSDRVTREGYRREAESFARSGIWCCSSSHSASRPPR